MAKQNSSLFQHQIKQLLLVSSTSLFIGFLAGKPFLALSIATLGYWLWQLKQLNQFEKWLNNSQSSDAPELNGFLGNLTDTFHYYQKRENKSKKRLEAAIQRTKDSANALREGLVTITSDNRLEWWNDAASQLLGFTSPQDNDQPVLQLLRNPDLSEYFKAGDFSKPLKLPSPINPKKTLEFRLNIFGRNDKLLLVKDISDLLHLEQVRQDFISNISHELRTPLTVLKGYLNVFTTPDAIEKPDISELLKPALQTMQAQTDRMQSLLEDLLTLSKLETPTEKVTKEIFPVRPILECLVKEGCMLGKQKNINIVLEMEQDFSLKGVQRDIYSALSNLVTNAIHYSGPNQIVKVNAHLSSGQAVITVIDKGMGIDPTHLTRITERFYRVDPSRQTSTGGTGLGLAIVKHVMIRHKGQLNIKSQIGKGSRFQCRFPASIVSK